MTGQRKSGRVKRGIARTKVKLALAGLLIAGLSACGGGGGGDSSDDVDLRAAYDRINRNCMTHADVEKAVGVSPSSSPNSGRRNWTAGNQRLDVTFARLDNGVYVSNGVQWRIIAGEELEKGFDPNACQ